MVNRKSLKNAVASLNQWDARNPNAGVRQRLSRSVQYLKESTELNLSIGTLPSMIAPIPKDASDKINRAVKKFRGW